MDNILYAIFADNDPDTYVYKVTASKEEAEKYFRNGFVYKELYVTAEEKSRFLNSVK